ncbi:hypothetical protein BH23GEM3_BH23GEM3_18380 [soil metagenome]
MPTPRNRASGSLVCVLLISGTAFDIYPGEVSMIGRLRTMGILPSAADDVEENASPGTHFTTLRLYAAEMFFAAGANAALHYFRERARQTDAEGADEPSAADLPVSRRGPPAVAAWAPALLAPVAGAAQVMQALRPSESTHLATRVLNGAVVGLSVAGVADSIYGATKREERLSLAPLLLGYAGVLGFLLDRQEGAVAESKQDLARRARIVERLVPRRKPKIERIVVHV